MKRISLSMAAVVCFTTVLGAQTEQPRIPEILSSGRGEVRIAPDKAILVMVVDNRSPSASDAASLTARGVASTIAALKAAGAIASQITNGGYSVTADDLDRNTRKPKAFIARNSIRVEITDLTTIGRLIDVALESGATQVQPSQFSSPNAAEARREALGLAVAEAKRDAEALAAAAGGGIGRLLTMSTGAAQPNYRAEYDAVMVTSGGMASAQTTIAPNDLVIAAVVGTRWEFVPRR